MGKESLKGLNDLIKEIIIIQTAEKRSEGERNFFFLIYNLHHETQVSQGSILYVKTYNVRKLLAKSKWSYRYICVNMCSYICEHDPAAPNVFRIGTTVVRIICYTPIH